MNKKLDKLRNRRTPEELEKRAKKIKRRRIDKMILDGVRKDEWRKWA